MQCSFLALVRRHAWLVVMLEVVVLNQLPICNFWISIVSRKEGTVFFFWFPYLPWSPIIYGFMSGSSTMGVKRSITKVTPYPRGFKLETFLLRMKDYLPLHHNRVGGTGCFWVLSRPTNCPFQSKMDKVFTPFFFGPSLLFSTIIVRPWLSLFTGQIQIQLKSLSIYRSWNNWWQK